MRTDTATAESLAELLWQLVVQVDRELGQTVPSGANLHTPFAELLDSMGLVEFLLRLADELGTTADAIEKAASRKFGTVLELAAALHAAGFMPREAALPMGNNAAADLPQAPAGCWLGAAAACLPETVQSSVEIDRILHHPPGWLEKHAGIRERRLWCNCDPLDATARAGREVLEQAAIGTEAIGALLVTSEAPPLLMGLAAAVHARLGLRADVPALEVGGACTGFLSALWLGRALLTRVPVVLLVAVEAPSLHLKLEPGVAGAAAALFGDGAAACVLSAQASDARAVPVVDVALGANGNMGHLLRVGRRENGDPVLEMDGQALAGRAVRTMAGAGRALLERHGLRPADVKGVVAHGGNGRMPALLARQLDVSPERVWSETSVTGNLGSASLPVAWAARGPASEPVLWTAAGAGLTWGAALTGAASVQK